MIDEEMRLDELRRYDLSTADAKRRSTASSRLAALACDAPIAYISLVDETRVWNKAEHGAALGEAARHGSFDDDTIRTTDCTSSRTRSPMHAAHVVADGHGPRAVRSTPGAPLVTPRGHVLGTMCVLDRAAAQLAAGARALLELVARSDHGAA